MQSARPSSLLTSLLPPPLSSLPLSPALHYLAALLSALILFLCYSNNKQDSLEQELDKEKIRIVEEEEEQQEEQAKEAAPYPVLLPPARSSFLLPTPCFQWPQHAGVVNMVRGRRQGATHLSQELRGKLQELGIYRGQEQGKEHEQEQKVEGAAMAAGKLLPRRSVRISFDTFQAKARPGLETTSEEDEGSLSTDANLMTLVMLGRIRRRQAQPARKTTTPPSQTSSAYSESSTSTTSTTSCTASYPPSVLGLENLRRLVPPL